MEEEKAAALYDELTRKGEGAARFKQGLGFSSSSSSADPARGSALPSFSSSSNFLNQFVKASSPSKANELGKQSQLNSIRNKLKKKAQKSDTMSSTPGHGDRDTGQLSLRTRDKARHSSCRSRSSSPSPKRRSRSCSRSRSRDRCRHSRRQSSSRSPERYRHSRRRSRSRSRSRGRDEYYRRRRRSRSESPRQRKWEKSNKGSGDKLEKERIDRVNFTELIDGFDKMTPAEKVKAKMKLQLSETAEKDERTGMGTGWERFNFNKDAPLDDEEIEAVEDDAALVKHIGQSFRFSTVEARREEEIKAAHDEAMFGASSLPPATETHVEEEAETIQKQTHESASVNSLVSDQVLTMHQGSWRDRLRRS